VVVKMRIEELISRVAEKWKGIVHINITTKGDFSWIEFKTFASGEYEFWGQENPNAYNFIKEYDLKIIGADIALDPLCENMLIINTRPLMEKEKDLGDQGW
jgi:hypothetical protein